MAPDIWITNCAACDPRSVRRRTYAPRPGAHHSDLLEVMPMKRLPTLVLLAALLPSFAWTAPAFAQVARPATSLAQAERNAVELKQGMTLDEVQQLLGKPRRTTLKSTGGANAPWQGTLQWIYVWNGSAASSSLERSLNIEFAAKAADQWQVNGWGWANY